MFPPKNALKLTYGKVEFQNFPGVKPPDPLIRRGYRPTELFYRPPLGNPGSATAAGCT